MVAAGNGDEHLRGYEVVLRHPIELESARNSRYRGIDRQPPWLRERHEAGWDDPYMSGFPLDDSGLVHEASVAFDMRQKYAEVWRDDELEVILVDDAREDGSTLDDAWAIFLGYDLAADSGPFQSAVRDFPNEPEFVPFLLRLNENGLFNRREDVLAFARAVDESPTMPDKVVDQVIWRVFSVPKP